MTPHVAPDFQTFLGDIFWLRKPQLPKKKIVELLYDEKSSKKASLGNSSNVSVTEVRIRGITG